MKLAIAFTNFGPYHLARLRALGISLGQRGRELVAHEMAGEEKKYPWRAERLAEPFTWTTLFPDHAIEDLSAASCVAAMTEALDRDRPDAVAVVGYARPESMAALKWAENHGKPAILLSETQEIDHPRAWWKEAVKRRRVRRFAAALVGGERHRAYLAKLGMPFDRIVLGYNAVDNVGYASRTQALRSSGERPPGLADRDYFLAVNRFVPEKNLVRLVHAFAMYRADAAPECAWDLVLCGGGPDEAEVDSLIRHLGLKAAIHRPGFLQESELAAWYAHASAFVHPSRMEPWGLVVNEAAACGLPLLVSDRAGCVETLVPDPPGATGRRIDPDDVDAMAGAMAWMAGLEPAERNDMGCRASRVVFDWGPERFASGLIEALELANSGSGAPSQVSREEYAR
ncbi:MAG: glycosyltransferase [Planctomycetota bacterium]|nr:glycosyltransferase [Planctomycetota bacterium]